MSQRKKMQMKMFRELGQGPRTRTEMCVLWKRKNEQFYAYFFVASYHFDVLRRCASIEMENLADFSLWFRFICIFGHLINSKMAHRHLPRCHHHQQRWHWQWLEWGGERKRESEKCTERDRPKSLRLAFFIKGMSVVPMPTCLWLDWKRRKRHENDEPS